MKLFIRARGKSDRVMPKKLSKVIANGLSHIGSKIADCSRIDRIRTHAVGRAAKPSRASIIPIPTAFFTR